MKMHTPLIVRQKRREESKVKQFKRGEIYIVILMICFNYITVVLDIRCNVVCPALQCNFNILKLQFLIVL